MYFDRVLGESDRKDVESYLMWKWLGMLPPGRSNFTEATLTGGGTVTGVAQSALPRFSDGYTGTIALDGNSLDFCVSVSSGQVEGAIAAPGATLAMDGTVTLNISLDPENGHLDEGSFLLVDAGSVTGVTGWNLNLSGAPDLNGRASLLATGGKVFLQVAKSGMMILIK
jgi:hypothetical protein